MGLGLLQPQSSKAQFSLENILSNKNLLLVKPFSSSTNNKAREKIKINKVFTKYNFTKKCITFKTSFKEIQQCFSHGFFTFFGDHILSLVTPADHSNC